MSVTFAIIPAAGRSRRMGRPKLLLPWRGTTVLEEVLRAWTASRIDHTIVVAHVDDRQVHACCRAAGVDLVVPTPPPAEMKDSVVAGLEYIDARYQPSHRAAWLLAPADMPQLSSGVIDRLIAEHACRIDEPAILVPTYDRRRGHPVLLPWPLAAEVARLGDDEGINSLVARRGVVELPCDDPGLLSDIDTPEDYRRLHDR